MSAVITFAKPVSCQLATNHRAYIGRARNSRNPLFRPDFGQCLFGRSVAGNGPYFPLSAIPRPEHRPEIDQQVFRF